MSDIGKDLQNAYNEGYEKAKQDMIDEGYVKVTKCRDCKSYDETYGVCKDLFSFALTNELHNFMVGTNGYCSWGEPES